MSDLTISKTLDLKGLLCPIPVVKMAIGIRRLKWANCSKPMPPILV
jgi:TusA-related sulfurtransferase